MEFSMLDLNEFVVTELKKLSKPAFNLDDLMTTAGDLKYTREIKRLLSDQLESPSDELVRLFASKVFNGSLTPPRREYFAGITKRSFNQLINEKINERLKSAMAGAADIEAAPPQSPTTPSESSPTEAEGPKRENLIQTTDEELEGFYVVKSLLRDIVDPERITHRDTQSYMGILLDNNNRKPLARLYLNRSQKYLGIFDENRSEKRMPLQNLNDIYRYADELRRVFAYYEREKRTDENRDSDNETKGQPVNSPG